MPEVTGRCPMCEAELVVTHLRCQQCGTGLDGVFQLTKFDRLSRGQLRFIETFIKNRGVIRDVEREMNISYPTVRSRLDEVIAALGYDVAGAQEAEPTLAAAGAGAAGATGGDYAERRRLILTQLEQGKVNPDEAAAQIERLRSGGD